MYEVAKEMEVSGKLGNYAPHWPCLPWKAHLMLLYNSERPQ